MKLLGIMFVLAGCFLFSTTAFGQPVLLYQKNGFTGDNLGVSVASAGDMNGDGKADFIIGAFQASPGGRSLAGSAYVYSGATGALLYQKDGAAANYNFGQSVASAGDVNGDGIPDFIIGAYGARPGGFFEAGSAYVYSGATGVLLYEKNGGAVSDLFGWSVASAGDLNGDGKADFMIGVPSADPGGFSAAGSAYIYSGATGALLYQKHGAEANYSLGFSVASAGDLNGDGKPEFILGAISASPGGLFYAGSAYVYSGATGALLYQRDGAAAEDRFGGAVASAGDVNEDGRLDFIVGAHTASPGGRLQAGSAYVYSGATGALLYQKDGAAPDDNLGISAASAGDVNGDGKADFIIGARNTDPGGFGNAGSAYLYSGANGALLYQKNGEAAGDWLGFFVGSAGDVNGDGRADFIIGAYYASPGGLARAGSAYVYSYPCGGGFDLQTSIKPFLPGAGRGQWNWVHIICKNIGSCPKSATVVYTAPSEASTIKGQATVQPFSGWTQNVPMIVNQSVKTVTWTLPQLAPGRGFNLFASYKIPCALPTGTPLTITASSAPSAGDANPSNNTAQTTLLAVGVPPCNTFPNVSTSVQSLPSLAYGRKGSFPVGGVSGLDTLTYFIAFQNVGSGAVTDLVIRDTLDVNLDEVTFDSIGYSYPAAITINGKEVTWTLSGINLPDSTTDDSGSIGFVAYTVKPKVNTPLGAEIKNSALLYFDANTPFFTDTVSNSIICAGAKGDMNGDAVLTSSDVVLELNCTFLGTGICDLCFADLNCDGNLTSSDVVLELNDVFLGVPPTGCP